jgi:integrase
MSITKTPNGTYAFRVYVTDRQGDRKQIYRSDPSWTRKSHALSAQEQFLKSTVNPDPVTFGEVFSEYLEYKQPLIKKNSLYILKMTCERHILPVFNETRLDRITLKDIQTWQKTLVMSPYGNATIIKVQKFFKSVVHYAYLHDYIDKDPCRTMDIVKKQEIPNSSHRILSPGEFNQFLSVVDNPMYKTFYMVLYWCGLRFGEASALTFDDVDLLKGTLSVSKTYNYQYQMVNTPKTRNSYRVVEMPSAVCVALNDLFKLYRHYDHDNQSRVFPIGTAIVAQKKLNQWIKKSGVGKFIHHDLRHSCVSLLANAGFNDFQAAKRLGHDVKMFNETYGHLFDSEQKKMTKAMDKMSKN